MRKLPMIGSLLLVLGGIACGLQKEIPNEGFSTVVYQAGYEGYSHYRIPSLVNNGRYLFAFSEARKNSAADHGDISIVLRRSADQGRNWGEMIRVVEVPGESLQNPVPVYIAESRKWVLLFTKRTLGSDTESMIRDGTSEGYIGVYQVESLDDGLSWSEVREITPSVKKAHWRWYTVGPAGAIRLRYNDRFPGRIIVPANHSVDAGSDNDYLGAHVIYSDDEGASWKVGAVDSEGQSTVNPNETTVVELKDGTLYFNTRNHSSTDTIANRAITYSRDGGLHFTAPFAHEPQLTTPVVHASLTRNRNTLFFFAPFDRKDRIDLSMWKSKDEGRSWTYDRLIYKGASAYSSVCLMAENMLGLLLEADGYDKILYNRIMVK